MSREPQLVTQKQWASELGVSVRTFLRWRREGVQTRFSGKILIPTPVDLPGWPRWKRADVARVSRVLVNGKRRLFGRAQASQLESSTVVSHADERSEAADRAPRKSPVGISVAGSAAS